MAFQEFHAAEETPDVQRHPDYPRHTRPVPEEWPTLYAATEAVLQEDLAMEELAAALLGIVMPLDDERLEKNRYYGIGEHMKDFAGWLAQPGTAERIIREATASIVGAWEQASETLIGLTLNDMGPEHFRPSLAAYVSEARVEPVTRYLTGALHTTSLDRRAAAQMMIPVENYVNVLTEENATNPDLVTDFVARTPFDAANIVATHTLRHLAYQKDAYNVELGFPVDPVLADAATVEGLREINWMPLMTGAARLRIDELLGGKVLGAVIGFDDSGTPAFKRENLKPEPKPVEHEYGVRAVIHSGRLRCPALNVEGLMSNVVEIMQTVMVEGQATVLGERDEGA